MKTKGYSLWLMPQGKAYANLAKLIDLFSKKYSSPQFDPHVTLVGGIIASKEDALEKTRELSSFIRPYRLQLRGIDYTDYYLKSLFIKAGKTVPVMRANKIAGKVFNIKLLDGYLPHLSLMYGDFPETLKREIIKKERLHNLKYEFLVNKIHLYDCNGTIGEWKKVSEFELSA